MGKSKKRQHMPVVAEAIPRSMLGELVRGKARVPTTDAVGGTR